MEAVVRLREARKKVASAGLKLARPTPALVDECRGNLEAAAELLVTLRVEGDQNSIAAFEIRALQKEIDQVRRLLQQAAEFYLGWGSMLALAVGGYGVRGEAAEAPVPHAVLAEG